MVKNCSISLYNTSVNNIPITHTLKCNGKNYEQRSSRDIKYIVIHYTGNVKDTALANARYFANNSTSSSAHFFVDENNIYQSINLKDIAWHCGCSLGYKNTACRNSNSIGIEMCTSGNSLVSQITQNNAAQLVADLCYLLGISATEVDKYVLRHYDIVASNKQCPAQFVTYPEQWKKFKNKIKELINKKQKEMKKEMTQEDFNRMMVQYFIDASKEKEDSWATEAIKWAKAKGMIAGDNSMPRKPVTREEVITMIYRVFKDKI